MRIIESAWKRFLRRHPSVPVAAIFLLLLAQGAYWIRWEARRKPVSKANPAAPKLVAGEVSEFEFPYDEESFRDIPSSPFTPNSVYFALPSPDETAQQPEEPVPEPPPIPAEPAPEPPPPQDPAEELGSLRYRGLMKTSSGLQIVFIEDANEKTTLRMMEGESVGGWRLDYISRGSVVFTGEDGSKFEIPRVSQDPEPPESATADKPSSPKQTKQEGVAPPPPPEPVKPEAPKAEVATPEPEPPKPNKAKTQETAPPVTTEPAAPEPESADAEATASKTTDAAEQNEEASK